EPESLAAGEEWIPGMALEWDGRQIEGEEDAGGSRALDFTVDQTAENCQSLCLDDPRCGAWHYEPTGSYLVNYPRCHLKGRAGVLRLRREGEGWVAGVKPGEKLIATETEAE